MKIKTLTVFLAITLFAGGCAHIQGGGYAAQSGKSKTGDGIPKTKKVKLSNGMTVHLLADHELPIFDIHAMIKAGAIWEPAEKSGLASLTGSAIRSGGTESRAPEVLDRELDNIAGSVETSISEESGAASLSVLSKDIEKGLEIFADVLRHPRFANDRLELAKARLLDSIRRENDEPAGIADRELKKLMYKGSPRGVDPTLETVESVTRDDIIAFYKKFVKPQNIMLGITGDFDEKTIIEKLEKAFGDWKEPDTEYPPVPQVTEEYIGGVYLAEKKTQQAVIRFGELAVKKTNPDYFALRVVDETLGGNGFSSRLMQKIRTEKGLAYSVYSMYNGGRWELGQFMIGADTKNLSAIEVMEMIRAEVNRVLTEPISDKELKLAKDSIVNSFVFVFETPSRIVDQRMIIDYYGLPEDYLETYREKIMAVTAESALAAARKYIHPNGFKIMVVGDPSRFTKPLSVFGGVTSIKLRDYSSPD